MVTISRAIGRARKSEWRKRAGAILDSTKRARLRSAMSGSLEEASSASRFATFSGGRRLRALRRDEPPPERGRLRGVREAELREERFELLRFGPFGDRPPREPVVFRAHEASANFLWNAGFVSCTLFVRADYTGVRRGNRGEAMKKIEAYIKPFKLDEVKEALMEAASAG